MKKYLLLLLAACLLVAGQIIARARLDEPEVRQFDSYGRITTEDVMARLDNFSIELAKSQDATGYLVCYGPEGEGQGTGKYMLQVQKDYLLNTRGLDEARIQTIYGGRHFKPYDMEIELWIAPHGADAPELKGYESSLESVRGKLTEYESWDGYADALEGPPFGSVPLAGLADALRQQPKSVAYIVAFNLRGAPPGTWRRVAKREADSLQRHGISSERIKIIYGGEIKADEEDLQRVSVQLWVLPADAPPPVEEAKPEKTPKRAAQLGTYYDFVLKYKDEERRIFEGFLDVLRADARLNVCLVIRPRTDALELAPDQLPDIDQLKLAEKWRSELTEKYRINMNRITVMPVDAGEAGEGTIEVWVVPAGDALPNPYSFYNWTTDESLNGP